MTPPRAEIGQVLADAPTWLIDLTRAERPRERVAQPSVELDHEADVARAVDWLKRHAPEHGTYNVACRVLDFGLSVDVAAELMADVWNERRTVPRSYDHIRQRVEHAAEYRQAPIGSASAMVEFEDVADEVGADALKPATASKTEAVQTAQHDWLEPEDPWAKAGASPARDLPRGILPDVLDVWAADEAARKGVALGAIAMPALAAFAGCISARNVVQVKQHDTGHTDRPVLWAALVGGPGSGKSPAIKAAADPLLRADKRRKAQFAKEMEALSRSEAARKGTKPAGGAQAGERPRNRSRVIQDVTAESALQREAESGNGCVLYVDELSAFLGSLDAYRANKSAVGKDAAFWLSAKQGDSYEKDRVSTGALRADCHAVSIIGGIQPDVIRKVGHEMSGNGMMQRMLMHNMGARAEPEDRMPDAAAGGRVHAVAERLYGLEPDEFTPIFRFEPAADASRKRIVAFARDQIARDHIPTALKGWLDKLEGEWARIALVLHWVEWSDSLLGEIGDWPPDTIGSATAEQSERFLLEYQWGQQRYFYDEVLGSGGESRAEAQQIAGHILAHELSQIDNRRAQQSSRRMSDEERAAGLAALVAAGWLQPTGRLRGGRPGRWAINPLVHERFAERAFAEAQRRASAQCAIADAAAARREANA